jgi:hypothetical protein
MRRVLAGFALFLSIASVAHAGTNSGCGIFLDLDGTAEDWWDAATETTSIFPEVGEEFDVYVGLASKDLYWDPDQGWEPASDLELTSIAFDLEVASLTAVFVGMECLLPGGLIAGEPGSGFGVATWGCEVGPLLYVARLTFRFHAAPGDILVTGHPVYQGNVWDCSELEPQADSYCVIGHVGVGQEAHPGEEDCHPNTPVQRRSWGSLKALYRGSSGGWRPN